MNLLLNTSEDVFSFSLDQITQLNSPNQAVLFSLAHLACQLESAKALEFYRKDSSEIVSSLIDLHQSRVCSNMMQQFLESPVDFGFKDRDSVMKKFSQLPAETLSYSFSAELGKKIAEQMRVPEFGLSDEHEMVRESFRKVANSTVQPLAEKIHREDSLLPEEFIKQFSELGCFGLSIPESFGGFQQETDPDHLGMVLVTEELSRGSLAAAGSLITRPEILARALLKGGSESQKQYWLPKIAAGEKMVGIAVTEPDYGSNVAEMKFSATPLKEGDLESGWLLNGTKTWCTFAGRADVLALLARTDKDLSLRHKGLSLILVEKPIESGHSFELFQNEKSFTEGEQVECSHAKGRMEGRAIPTIGYRGMHSFEIKFENWFVPHTALVGEADGLGKGFYLQMEGFSAGRLQTAARANGLMHAALEQAIRYSMERSVFGVPVAHHAASSQKLAYMASALLASRALTYESAKNLGDTNGASIAAMAKLFCSRTAEWVTREALQLHGGMGYAEEYAVSRYFLDARVLSIFEGAEEVLAVKVIAPYLFKKRKM